tara:strand:+ start:122 stop:643 length:522 start_codon:yes stop_codon:yes gene_type:complete
MSMHSLKKVTRDYRLLNTRERAKLESGVGVVQYTIVLRRTDRALSGYELDSMDGRVGMVTCNLVTVEQKRGRKGQLPHQIVTSLRGLRQGLSAERRVQNFFRALIQLKGCKVIELEALPTRTIVRPKEVVKPKATAQEEAGEVEVEVEEEVGIKKPTDEEIPESWEDFSSDEE